MFRKNEVNITLFIKNIGDDLIIVQIYINEILFGSIDESLYHVFTSLMSKKFEMSMMREVNFFFGFQVR